MTLLNKNNLIYLIFIIVIIKFFDLPYKTYSILKSDYSQRMTRAYGFCNKESWGFYNHVVKKFNLKNQKINLINQGGFVNIDALFKEIEYSEDENSKFLMLLNFQSEENKTIYSSDIKNIKNYTIKYRFNNCYLLELND